MKSKQEILDLLKEVMTLRQQKWLEGWEASKGDIVELSKLTRISLYAAKKMRNEARPIIKWLEIENEPEEGVYIPKGGKYPTLEWVQNELMDRYNRDKVNGKDGGKWFRMILSFKEKFGEVIDTEKMRIIEMNAETLIKETGTAIEELSKLSERMAWADGDTGKSGIQTNQTPDFDTGDYQPE